MVNKSNHFRFVLFLMLLLFVHAYGVSVARYAMVNSELHNYLDRMDVVADDEKKCWWFGIYDGHGDSEFTVNYLRDNLKRIFDETLSRDGGDDFRDVFETTFHRCQKEIVDGEKGFSGSTATVAFLCRNKLHVAWVGDSSAIKISLLGQVTPLIVSHKTEPGSPEFTRIKEILMKKPRASIDGFYFIFRRDNKNEKLVGYTLHACRYTSPFERDVPMASLHGMTVNNEFMDVYKQFNFEGISLESIFCAEFSRRERFLRAWFKGFIQFLRSYDDFDLGVMPEEWECKRFKKDREYFIPDLIEQNFFSWLSSQCCCDCCPLFLRSFFPYELQQNGVCVQCVWRIHTEDDCVLSVSRSFGDADFVDYGVIATPACVTFDITPYDKYLIFASDGLWDAFGYQEVADFVSRAHSRGGDIHQICRALCAAARDRGSSDDISVILVDLSGM